MQCLACRADNKMLLMDVLRDDTMKVPVIERQIYMCSACRYIARRLVFRRTQMPHGTAVGVEVSDFKSDELTVTCASFQCCPKERTKGFV
jgi:hypothetical protein